MTPTTQCAQHSVKNTILLSDKFTTNTFVEFRKFNWFYDLLRYMRQNTSLCDLPIKKCAPTEIKQIQSGPTAVTKSKVHQSRPSVWPSNNESELYPKLSADAQ